MREKVGEEVNGRVKSFRYAFEGWWYVLRTQHNSWIHAIVSVIILGLGFWLKISAQSWATIVLAMMIVWMAEFMNTAIEAIVDMVMPDPHPLAKIAKDVAAAAVLVGAIGAILIGLLLLGPPLYERLIG